MNEPIKGGETMAVRVCGWTLGVGKGYEHVCKKDAVTHIAFSDWCGFVCAEHEAGVLGSFDFRAYHSVGSDCGMPGSHFDVERNVCRYHGDELPVVESREQQREVCA